MNGETLQRIVEEIVSRLHRRAQSTATLSVTQLRDADCPALFCQHASLRILLIDLPLLGQLADAETGDAAARKIHDALAFGIRVQLSLHSQLLPVIPVKKLARLPLVFTDEHGLPLVLHAGSVLSYRDVALLSRGRVVVHRKCIVTAMARDAANARNIQLITGVNHASGTSHGRGCLHAKITFFDWEKAAAGASGQRRWRTPRLAHLRR